MLHYQRSMLMVALLLASANSFMPSSSRSPASHFERIDPTNASCEKRPSSSTALPAVFDRSQYDQINCGNNVNRKPDSQSTADPQVLGGSAATRYGKVNIGDVNRSRGAGSFIDASRYGQVDMGHVAARKQNTSFMDASRYDKVNIGDVNLPRGAGSFVDASRYSRVDMGHVAVRKRNSSSIDNSRYDKVNIGDVNRLNGAGSSIDTSRYNRVNMGLVTSRKENSSFIDNSRYSRVDTGHVTARKEASSFIDASRYNRVGTGQVTARKEVSRPFGGNSQYTQTPNKSDVYQRKPSMGPEPVMNEANSMVGDMSFDTPFPSQEAFDAPFPSQDGPAPPEMDPMPAQWQYGQ